MNNETIVVYKDEYDRLNTVEWALRDELATLRGQIRALASLDDHAEFVNNEVKKLATSFE